jgi:hypothetical protein
MNQKVTRRGYVPDDEREFSGKWLATLQKAQVEIQWLLDRGYQIKKATEFVGNHYLLSSRQRLALFRATAPTAVVRTRADKVVSDCRGKIVSIDGLNLIITLEVALSESTLIKCMDGTIRDLAGLRGTYRLIDKTDKAICLIGQKLEAMNIAGAVFYLDAPVSNTGKLKTRIMELLNDKNYTVSVELAGNADIFLKDKPYVVTTDAIILNDCVSWINMAENIITEGLLSKKYVDLSLSAK